MGLDRYDGDKILKYRYNETQAGTISNNGVRCIFEDSGKKIWFGTIDGLNLYNPAKDNFELFKNNPYDTNSINSNIITSIIEDKKGNLWILTSGNCLNKWVPDTRSFIRYPFENSLDEAALANLPSAHVMSKDSKGNLWIASFNSGINRFDPESGKFEKFDDPSVDFGVEGFKYLYIDNQDKIWIASNGSGFFSYDPLTSKFEHFPANDNGKGPNQNLILDIIPESDRYLLLGVDHGGINRFDKVSKTFEYFRSNQANEEGLSSDGIWCMFRDREGILWIGTSSGGVNYYNPKIERFKLFVNSSNGPYSLSYNSALCFYEDYQGMIWIGTDGGGLNVYNPETGIFKVFKHDPSDPYSISGNAILSIVGDKDHDLWIGTWDAGLNRYDRQTGRFYTYLPEENNPSSVSARTFWTLNIDHNNILWAGGMRAGIDLLDKKKGVIERFRADTENPEAISSNQCWFYNADNENNMWIGTSNGLNLYNSKTNSFKVFKFPVSMIQSFFRDIAGNLWVGSATGGMYYCKPDGTIIKTFTVADGLPDNSIRAIIEGNNGNLWISTANGISRFDTKTQEFRNYSKSDGLQGNEFHRQSFLKTSKGDFYFGGFNGFNSFNPDSMKDNDFIPPVYITDFQIFNKPVEYGGQGAQFQTNISEAKEITLTWKQSVFSFSFNAINYTYPEKNQYAYIMEGFEKEWNYTNNSRKYVSYTNLDPGEYTFKVKASNNDGIWNEKGVSLRVIILPPWWGTWWFRIIMFFAISSIFAYIFLSRVQQLKNQKALLEKSVAMKTGELQRKNAILEERQHQIEEQRIELLQQKESLIEMNNALNELNISKDRFFSIIAHDLKNPFNTIIGLSEMLAEGGKTFDQATIKKYAELINTSAFQTSRLLENLLEWANSQRGKVDFTPVSINLNELFNEEFNLLNDLAEEKNIEIKNSLPKNLTIIADLNMLKTILRNLISNAIKFTHKNGKVVLSAIIANNQAEMSVSDSGIGMTKETIDKLFRIDGNLSTRGTENEKGTGLGLLLCKEFVEKHGGRIWAESEPGKGSIFKFVLPLDQI
jgi:signal transduction histidine kinase/ligand-binding sensor domain-containing protein